MSNAALWSSYKQIHNPETKKQIVLNYMNLVHYVIQRTSLVQNGLLDRRDFFQFGIEGLSEAIDRFDPDYGTKFETYAIKRIRGKIYDELRKYTKKVETTVDVDTKTSYPVSTLSLNQPFREGDGLQLYETLPNDSEIPDVVLEKKDLKEKLLETIKSLPQRERTILSLYYYEDLNYKEIAQVFNITVSRVSQIHSRVLDSLKLQLEEYNV